MELKLLKEQARNLDAVIRIGKNALNDNVHQEVDKLLKKRKLIKIKILNNCPVEDKDGIIAEVVDASGATLVSKIGNVFCIFRERAKK
jgi:RNA-binding protein